jgi:deoxyxylulose-5-phosphate synthase
MLQSLFGRIVRRPHGLLSIQYLCKRREDRVAVLSIGTLLHECLVAANEVEKIDPSLGVTVAENRFMKPLDVDVLKCKC